MGRATASGPRARATSARRGRGPLDRARTASGTAPRRVPVQRDRRQDTRGATTPVRADAAEQAPSLRLDFAGASGRLGTCTRRTRTSWVPRRPGRQTVSRGGSQPRLGRAGQPGRPAGGAGQGGEPSARGQQRGVSRGDLTPFPGTPGMTPGRSPRRRWCGCAAKRTDTRSPWAGDVGQQRSRDVPAIAGDHLRVRVWLKFSARQVPQTLRQPCVVLMAAKYALTTASGPRDG
jgi:hypothetical protein